MAYRSVLRADLFAGKSMVVTGGGSGIGRCIAHELSSLGAVVTIIGRNAEKLQQVQDEIHQDGGRVFSAVGDIRDEQRVKELVSGIVARDGRIDGLVNNAGGQFPSRLEDISLNGWKAVIDTNLTGGFLMAREVFRRSMVDHGGAMVNIIADMWGGMPGMGHSGAARAGMDNLTKTAAFEWAPSGVRVNAVAPGWILSSGMDTYSMAILPFMQAAVSGTPQKRMGREAEVSAVVCFLLSEGAAFITGTTVRVDGGISLGNRAMPAADHRHKHHFDGFHREQLPEIADKL